MFRFVARRTLFTSSILRNSTAQATTATTASNAAKETAASTVTVKSSCKAGTSLNLKVKKSGEDPVALEDSEYPEWLWTVLDPKAQQAKLDSDPAKKAKKEMRLRNKKKIKMNNFIAQM
ncbi:unnamed protein product [Cyberlindnera jadinii]|uniref:Large ribosomal subunit protein mL54 n=1 Tax=Cyberlindnera jadinii (strain ATCC 18201 / CBS 1600 / BCRC 20928 / JCM 3617 / NBRC 0987 / NRRL Y-1542) TaxID=983966 RepID=A0A0H5C4E5_CYBJN|nr:hypothetical protein CYBJADRAFT_167176 [Cyberlindnera jadinii NRRL Y-1542]ODV74523.1 hypothetical protein CYBJADRAFT_167176 [Cyberlindnera jadinii NRRL Y-1542]CEP23000.1 unnamed protein product [Cyberlindnera jadinii]